MLSKSKIVIDGSLDKERYGTLINLVSSYLRRADFKGTVKESGRNGKVEYIGIPKGVEIDE